MKKSFLKKQPQQKQKMYGKVKQKFESYNNALTFIFSFRTNVNLSCKKIIYNFFIIIFFLSVYGSGSQPGDPLGGHSKLHFNQDISFYFILF